MRSVFGLFGWMSGIDRINRNRTARSHRLETRVECLETRDLMTAGTVVQLGAAVSETPPRPARAPRSFLTSSTLASPCSM